jgi:TctA family transporter
LPLAFSSLQELLGSAPLLGFIALAIPIGMLFGAVPGLGGKTAIAMAIPFVFGMDPLPAAVFLVAMHAVVHTGGSVPSILLGIPGTGPDAATVVDGYPLARQGQAGRALGASLTASGLGGWIGALALVALFPILRPVLLVFGPAETFALAIAGLVFVGSVSASQPVAGWIVGGAGLLVAFVGLDPMLGIERLTGSQLFLWDGVDVTTAMLGIFTLPEALALGCTPALPVGARAVPPRFAELVEGCKDVWRHRALSLRTSLLGVGIGMIPGLGGDVASWVCYGHAVQSSKTPERFGHGAIEGVIAPETANNSKEGGALLPTLAFGIPGSSGMALLLGAFVAIGVQPGPQLLLERMDFVWTLVWTLAVANLAAAALFFALGPLMVRWVRIRPERLFPFVVSLALLGSYVVTGHGGIAEVSLHQSLALWGPGFLLDPETVTILAAATIGAVVARRRRRTASAVAQPGARTREERWLTGALLCGLLGIAALATHWPPEARLLPLGTSLVCAGLAAVHLLQGWSAEDASAPRDPRSIPAAWLGLFTAAALGLGLGVGAPLATFLFLRLRARESLAASVGIAAVCALLIPGTIGWGLGIPLYEGWVDWQPN